MISQLTALLVLGLPAPEPVVKTAIVNAPRLEVWKAWTTTEGVRSFMARDVEVDLKLFGNFEPRFQPNSPLGSQGAEGCRVLSYLEGKMLSFTWNNPPILPTLRNLKTFVVIELADEGANKTKVTLTHSGWPVHEKTEEAKTYFNRAWGNVLANLVKRFEDGPIQWAQTPGSKDIDDRVLKTLEKFAGTWKGTCSVTGQPITYTFSQEGKRISAKGMAGDAKFESWFGWDPDAKGVYYFAQVGDGPPFYGTCTMDGEDVFVQLGPAGGDSNALTGRFKLEENKLRFQIGTIGGELVTDVLLAASK
jgi:uncharacterized protein YndB with AHSA1/START domain